ncbi:hypothetical protein, partial, partial [Parasitella parasitica]
MSPSRGRPRFQLAADQFQTANKENATIVKYACPCCNHCFDELVNLGAHLDIHLGQHGASVDSEIKSVDGLPNVDDDNGFAPEDQPTIQEPLPTISPSLHPGNIAISPITVNPPRRNFDEAVIYACQQSGSQHA